MRSCPIHVAPQGPYQPLVPPKVPPRFGVTWDLSSNSSPDFSFDASHLKATLIGALGGAQLVKANYARTSGRFEVKIVSGASGGVGLTDSSQATNTHIGTTAGSIGWHDSGNVIRNNGAIATYSTYGPGDTIGVTWKSGFLYFDKNGVYQNSADPNAGTGGIDVSAILTGPALPAFSVSLAGDVRTANFGVGGFATPAASGVSAWDPAAVVTTNAYSLSAATGVFTLAGQAMTPAVAMPADTGTFSLTGNAATLTHGYTLVASTGTFTLTGNAAALEVGHRLIAASGTFTLTGFAMTPAAKMVAATGVFALTGNAVGLGVTMPASTGAFVLTGNPATLKVTMPASTGVFVLTGNAAGLNKTGAATLTAATGAFTLTGRAAGLAHAALLSAATGVFSLSDSATALKAARTLTAARGAFVLTGSAAQLAASRRVILATGAFTVTGRAANFRRSLIISLGTGAFLVIGYDTAKKHPDVATPPSRTLIGANDGRGVAGSMPSRLVVGNLQQRSA